MDALSEEWRVIADFPCYAISNFGLVKRICPGMKTYPGKILSTPVKPPGYPIVTLIKDGKQYYRRVHRLVAEAFLGDSGGLTVNHRDAVKTNNHVSNLEYLSQADNNKHAYELGLRPCGSKCKRAKLSELDISEIFKMKAEGRTQQWISNKFGVSRSNVGAILSKKKWKSVSVCPDDPDTTYTADHCGKCGKREGCPSW